MSQETDTVRSRLAPTPSGYLHPGNAFSFVLTWLLVRYHRGQLLLRIDDIDAERSRLAYVEDIFRTLHWLQLDWDAGPKDAADFEVNFSQLHRLDRYGQLLAHLRQAGVLYACNCSRSQVQASSVNGIYPGTCRHQNLPLDTPGASWRVYVPENTSLTVREFSGVIRRVELDRALGDFVVRRRNGLPAYQIASLADDLHHEINLIVRGLDLLPSTAAQLFLAQYLPENAFSKAIFYHHPLLKDERGQKLSKSAGALSLLAMRQQLESPASLYQALATVLSVVPTAVHNVQDLLAVFSPSALPAGETAFTSLL